MQGVSLKAEDSKSNTEKEKEPKQIKIKKWNIPYHNLQDFVPRHNKDSQDIQGLIREIFKETPSEYSPTFSAALHGLAGSGKSYITLRYIHDPEVQKKYNFRGWFKAADSKQLSDDYLAFAKEIGITSSLAATENIISLVKDWLEDNPGWILVYDNAPNIEMLQEYLPQKGGHILITSRNPNWTNPIFIDVMHLDEAISMVKQITQRNDPEISALCQDDLDRLPLALAQASAFILRKKITTAEYRKKFKEQAEKTLSSDLFPPSSLKHDPVAITWDMNIDEIKNKYPEAVEILNYCAYLAPENIPYEFFTKKLDKNDNNNNGSYDFDDLRQILTDFSMVRADPDRHVLSIHRLVQKILRLKLSNNNNLYLANDIAILNDKINYNWNIMETGQQTEPFISHGLKIAEHAKIQQQDLKLVGNILYKIGTYYLYHCRTPSIAIERLDQALEFYNPTDRAAVGSIYNHLAFAYFLQEDYQKSKDYNSKAFDIFNNLPNPDKNLCLAFSYRVKSYLLRDNDRDYEQAILCCGEALKIQNNFYETTPHISIARTEHDLGRIYCEQENYPKAKEQYQKALEISKKYHNANEYPPTPNTARTLHELGIVFRKEGNSLSAKENLDLAKKIKKNILQQVEIPNLRHPWLAETYCQLGEIYILENNLEKAKKKLTTAYEIFLKAFGAKNRHTVNCKQKLDEVEKALANTLNIKPSQPDITSATCHNT